MFLFLSVCVFVKISWRKFEKRKRNIFFGLFLLYPSLLLDFSVFILCVHPLIFLNLLHSHRYWIHFTFLLLSHSIKVSKEKRKRREKGKHLLLCMNGENWENEIFNEVEKWEINKLSSYRCHQILSK